MTDNVSTKLDAIARDLVRIEAAIQRNFDNVNVTRHASANDIHKVLGAIDEVLEILRGAALRTSGGLKVAGWLWPIIVALAAAAGLGGGVWLR